MEFQDDIIIYMCDNATLDYVKKFRLLNKTFKQFISLKFDIIKIVNSINIHYSAKNLETMHTIGLLLHTQNLKQKININKDTLLKYLDSIIDKSLSNYITMYRSVRVITTHSVILNLL